MLEKQRAAQEKTNEKSKDDPGPWNKRADSPALISEEPKPKPEPKPEVEKEDISKEDSSKSDLGGGSGKARYVPPALRNASGGSSGDNSIKPTTMASALRKLPKGSIPKMDDAQDFPSLSIVDR